MKANTGARYRRFRHFTGMNLRHKMTNITYPFHPPRPLSCKIRESAAFAKYGVFLKVLDRLCRNS